MKLKELLANLEYEVLKGSLDIGIDTVAYDSRKVIKGSMFICISGFKMDGHTFIQQAIENGAKGIIVEKDIPIDLGCDVTFVRVNDTRKAMSIIASNYYNYPSKHFDLVGVTGTNGKTTTVFLIEHILKKLGRHTGLIGTIENHIGDKIIPASRTTPESLDLQNLFADMRNASVDSVVMEVSSHALDLDRVLGAQFDIGVFTNLTLDHLDYHKTMEHYLRAKTKLFKMCKNAVINIDDEASDYIIREANSEQIYTYSTEDNQADFYAKDIELSAQGVDFTLVFQNQEHKVHYGTPGKFSVYNALAAIATCYVMEIPLHHIVKALVSIKGVKGRFQTVVSPKGYSVIVDYAHAPDGLLNVLKAVNEFAKGRIITVFGCGGDRDKSKRPIMGKIAGESSDFSVIVSDNPRSEDPETIINEIEVGMIETECPYTKIIDRKEGIHFALTMAEEDDVVLIAGKGHETYQEIGDKIIHFDDVEVVEEFIQGES